MVILKREILLYIAITIVIIILWIINCTTQLIHCFDYYPNDYYVWSIVYFWLTACFYKFFFKKFPITFYISLYKSSKKKYWAVIIIIIQILVLLIIFDTLVISTVVVKRIIDVFNGILEIF